jgi:hypothetical protein
MFLSEITHLRLTTITALNIQTGNNKLKLLTQKVLLSLESILQNAKQLQHARLSLHVRCPSDIQFPSPDNNLESYKVINRYNFLFTVYMRAIISGTHRMHKIMLTEIFLLLIVTIPFFISVKSLETY